jgi:hypothetical protein
MPRGTVPIPPGITGNGRGQEIKLENKQSKNKIMKTQLRMLQWMLVLLFAASSMGVMGQVGTLTNIGDQVVCLDSIAPYGVVLTAGSTYNWQIIPIAGGNGAITPGATPNLITVHWNSPGTCTLSVTETNSFGCVGTPQTQQVTINPLPLAVATPPTQTVCSDVAITTIVLSTSNGLVGTTFAWTRNNLVNVTGIPAIGTGDISGTLTNLTGVSQTVTFTITPTSAGGCKGIPITATVTVDPEPVAVATPSTQTVCSDIAITTIALTTSNGLAGTTFAWTRDNVVNVTGIPANGTGDISGTLTNLTGV